MSLLQRSVRRQVTRELNDSTPRRSVRHPDPIREQDLMNPTTPVLPITGHRPDEHIRSRNLQLIPEAMARAQYQQRLQEAEHQRLVRQAQVAAKVRRGARGARFRTRRVLAWAIS